MLHRHDNRCCQIGFGGYGYGGGYGAYGGCGTGGYGYEGWGIRWIYAFLVLIVIVLQFGKRDVPVIASTTECDCGVVTVPAKGGVCDNQLIDNSVLFIIVVFLLILCSGCWVGGAGNYGAAGGSGYGYY